MFEMKYELREILAFFAALLVMGLEAPCLADYQSSVLADAPLAYWQLNDAPGSTTVSNLGSTGAAANGTYNNGITLGVPGLVAGSGTAIQIGNGTTNNMETAPFEKYPTGSSGFSVEFWVKFETIPTGFANLVGDGTSTDFFNFYLMVYATSGGHVRAHVQTTSGITAIDSNVSLADDSAHMVVSTWDSTTGNLSLYLDGSLAATTPSIGAPPNTGSPIDTANAMVIGKDSRENVTATIDLAQAAIYNKALTASQIEAHYLAGVVTVPEPTSLTLLSAGLGGLLLISRSRRRP